MKDSQTRTKIVFNEQRMEKKTNRKKETMKIHEIQREQKTDRDKENF